MKGQRFADIPDIHCNVALLQGIPKDDFQDWFHQWHHCLTKCIELQREYLEGNSSC
jgi:hypothetical protein